MKRTKWLGIKTFSLVLLVTTVLLSLALWQLAYTSLAQQGLERQSEFQQQTFQTMQVALQKAIDDKQALVAAIARSAEVQQLVANGDEATISQWQSDMALTLPDVDRLCLFLQPPSQPDNTGCLPVSFATLASLRQLADSGQADVAVMQPGTEQAHILFGQPIDSAPAYPDASLLVAVDTQWLDEILDDSFVSSAYAEITQGKKGAAILTRLGDPQFRVGDAAHSQPVANSVWTLHYWVAPSLVGAGWVWMAALVVILVLAWWLRDWLFSRLLTADSRTLQRQLSDLEQEKLGTDYPLALTTLAPVSEHIHDLVIPRKISTQTAARPKPVESESLPDVVLTSDPEIIVEHALAQASKEKQQANPAPSLPDKAIFRHYDVRGKVGPQLNADVMLQLGQAVGSEALDQSQTRLVLGRDGRLSSDSLAEAFIKGVLSTGCDVIDLGQVPTPMVYFACEHLETHTGAMITGSHNPADYNGLKIVIAGKTLLGNGVQRLYERIKDKRMKQGQGQLSKESVLQAYIDRIKGEISLNRRMRIVIDCGNGVAGNVAPELFRALGCEVTELYCEVDGRFPHHHPDPGQPENMQDLIKAVKAQEAELGLAYDGDGDRLGVVDAGGNIIWPDRLLLLMAQHLLVDQPGATILYDVKCTNMLEDVISRAGGNPVMTPSGHSVIKSLMSEHDAMLAGEMTGHFFFRDRWYGFDDALYSAARLLELLAADPLERSATEVFAALPSRISTPEIIVDMAEGESHRFIEQLQSSVEFIGGKLSTVDGVRVDYPKGWGLVRASNTVPALTLRFEATSQEELEHIKQLFIQQMLQIKPTLSLLF